MKSKQQQELPIYVVLTMRSDFLGDCAQFRDLPEAMNDSQYLIPRLTRDQLQAAITGPVGVGNAQITPRLVNRLLNDVGDNPDQLPILQHALMRTWNYHKIGEPIDLYHYEAIGGMDKALSQHADEIYHQLPDDRCQKIAEKLFKCLTDNQQGQLLKTLNGHSSAVWGVAFSPDGKTIASASSDKTVRLWNQQGQLLKTLNGHSSAV